MVFVMDSWYDQTVKSKSDIWVIVGHRVVYQAQATQVDCPCESSLQTKKILFKRRSILPLQLDCSLSVSQTGRKSYFAAQCILNTFLILNAEHKVR